MKKLPTALTLAFASTLTMALVGCGNSGSQQTSQSSAPAPATAPTTPANATAVVPAGANSATATAGAATQPLRVRKLADGLIIKDIKIGKGPMVENGQTAIVHYTGMLMNGKVFDASKLHGNQPFPFVLGAGQVIPGWDIGVKGMRVGGIRELIIPPALAYGDQSPPGSGIPANSTLKFRVHLLGIQ
jgi:FKBP-type peptidyl-prolyl cis-trans isomerase